MKHDLEICFPLCCDLMKKNRKIYIMKAMQYPNTLWCADSLDHLISRPMLKFQTHVFV